MRYGQMRNLRTGQMVAEQIEIADSFWTRFRGLLGRPFLAPGEGLWLKPCQRVHMFGMKFPLSVWFLDNEEQVCEIIDALYPWHISPQISSAVSIIEFPAGWGKTTHIRIGDKLVWEENHA